MPFVGYGRYPMRKKQAKPTSSLGDHVGRGYDTLRCCDALGSYGMVYEVSTDTCGDRR